MINLQFTFPPQPCAKVHPEEAVFHGDGHPSARVMEYEVHPRSQETPISIPAGATGVIVWLGIK